MNSAKITLFAMALVLFQILLNGVLALMPVVNIAIVPLILIILPSNVKSVTCMISAFATGLCVDYLSDGVIGLNAAAMVAVAFARGAVFSIVLGHNQFNARATGRMKIKIPQYFVINLLVYSIWFAVYLYLDGLISYRISVQLIRFIVNVAINSTLALLLERVIDKELE